MKHGDFKGNETYPRTMSGKLFYTGIIIIAGIFLFLVPGFSHAGKRNSKPSVPLDIVIAADQRGVLPENIEPGEISGFTVTAVARIDAGKLKINVDLLGGTELVSGNTSWSGTATRGEKIILSFIVRTPSRGKGGILATAAVVTQEGASFSTAKKLWIGPEAKSKPQKLPSPKKDSKNRDVIEFR